MRRILDWLQSDLADGLICGGLLFGFVWFALWVTP